MAVRWAEKGKRYPSSIQVNDLHTRHSLDACPIILGHRLGSLLEVAYSSLPSQTCICLMLNVIHAVWHSVMLTYSPS